MDLLCLSRKEPGVAAKLSKMEEPRIGWVGHVCRRPFGCRKMLPGKKFPGAVGSVDM